MTIIGFPDREMASSEDGSRKVVEVSAKHDWMIMTGYLAWAASLLVIYYLANSPGTSIGDFAPMSVFP